MPSSREHTCHAMGCDRSCKPEWLMCYPHWHQVPKEIQRHVWATYQQGQCDGRATPSEAWHEAADAAIYAVAQKEGLLGRALPIRTLADFRAHQALPEQVLLELEQEHATAPDREVA